jgi:hypothetical protein
VGKLDYIFEKPEKTHQELVEARRRDVDELAGVIVPPILKSIVNRVGELEKRLDEVLGSVLKAVDSIEIPEPVDRADEVLGQIKESTQVDFSEVIAAMPPETDLTPVLKAIQNIKFPDNKVDFSTVIEAIKNIPKPVDKPTEWKIVYHRDKRGQIISTSAVAVK